MRKFVMREIINRIVFVPVLLRMMMVMVMVRMTMVVRVLASAMVMSTTGVELRPVDSAQHPVGEPQYDHA